MKKSVLQKAVLVAVLGSTIIVSAQEVFSWRDRRGYNAYSDTPRNLTPAETRMFNVRTQTSVPSVSPQTTANAASDPGSLAEQQAQLSQQVAARNKAIEEQNKQIAAENKKKNETSCKTARLNRQAADSIRSNNRDALIQRYEQDIKQFCN
ncbi:DUF4124 domain-containing protein [Snodgrassella sp. CFCC 13594]|uniref:DUF4124 domain-containing protein n=1 Tax=Snodgrassella sp. CFCC 13594 TaxID=1775559 RepID=UPI00083612DA|nr:DUF4124 domain-containing protein [Snodgrassella sp. CFCC 13594]